MRPRSSGLSLASSPAVQLCLDRRESLEQLVLVRALDARRQRHGPTIVAGQVAAVPAGVDVVQIAEQAVADQLHGVVVEDVIVPLVAHRQELLLLVGAADHLLALLHAVGHELLGEHVQSLAHGRDGHLGVEEQRQGDDDRLDPVRLGVVDQLLPGAVELDVLAGLRLAGPAVELHQPGAGRHADLAVKRPVHAVRPDVGDGLHFDVGRVDGPDEHGALVAGADHAHADRAGHGRAVAEVIRPEALLGSDLLANPFQEELAGRELRAGA